MHPVLVDPPLLVTPISRSTFREQKAKSFGGEESGDSYENVLLRTGVFLLLMLQTTSVFSGLWN